MIIGSSQECLDLVTADTKQGLYGGNWTLRLEILDCCSEHAAAPQARY